MGCCVAVPQCHDQGDKLADEIGIPPLIKEHPSEQASDSYQLNDLRSLEGIAELWSEKLYNQNPRNSGSRLSLQNTLSEKVRGNHTSNALSPITISTYYFVHAPNAEKQPNLLQSHSAPANHTKPPILNTQAVHDVFPRKISEDTDDDVVIDMDLPEFCRNGTLSPGTMYKRYTHRYV